MMSPRLRYGLPLLGVLALSNIACSTISDGLGPLTCDRSQPPTPYTEGFVENGVYMSANWGEEMLHFPGGMRYVFEHRLGRIPKWWRAYLAFSPEGFLYDEDNPEIVTGGYAEAAGNQAEMQAVDDETITIVNQSCSEYWLLVVVGAGLDPSFAVPEADVDAPQEDEVGGGPAEIADDE